MSFVQTHCMHIRNNYLIRQETRYMHSQFNGITQNRNTFNCFDCDVAVAVLNIITRDSKCGVNLKHV